MHKLQGIPVSPGVAIAPALVVDSDGYQIERCTIPDELVVRESEVLAGAVAAVAEDLERSRIATDAAAGSATGDIFAAQIQMLRDPRLAAELHRRIHDHKQPAIYAVSRVLNNYASALRKLNSPLLAERAQDVLDIQRQLLTQLGAIDKDPFGKLSFDAIVLANNLTPSETANLDRQFVRGFCTETGGPGGHTAIVAKGLELPAVVGLGPFLDQVNTAQTVIVDGDKGVLVIDPDEATLVEYRDRLVRRESLTQRLASLRDLPAETTDGHHVSVSANIEFPVEATLGLERGADGVGLYRTEFLYLASSEEPTEEDHYVAYREVVDAMDGRPVVIRTLDLGADKIDHRYTAGAEQNPFLGLRSIRLSLRHLDLFRIQLRAILRAAAHGDIRVMFPLITTLDELRRARMVLSLVAEDLQAEGIEHRSDIPVGMMVEVPAAVIMLESFVDEVDFFSIGTNDLSQYTLAVDRSNPYVADLYQSSDPAVLRLIQKCIQVSTESGLPLAVCGEMSSRPSRALLLIGMGVRRLSVPPTSLPRVKKAIRSVSLEQCQKIAKRALKLNSAAEVDLFLNDKLETLVPELAVL